ncbi:hypothetical protein [Marinobacterium lutimaris]|uniref:Uncharacterized protein n=1 Tax=Marinobacterium lutimaris TaxID=568106 RepID=A0A1H5XUV0_9GAMM|nr:hypothetical protein [Marinobacterium lutimaris]SEG15305.1 hypothetical protein SAMN05444390_1011507 [Marinobacterium lutimaris]
MDLFGIGNALQAMVRIYTQSARRTGRTTLMLDSLKDGDRVVCRSSNEARRLKNLVRERGLDVGCIVVSPECPERLFDYGTPQGRTVFDHDWVESYYELSLARAVSDIERLHRQFSGYGEVHRETARAARECARWRL